MYVARALDRATFRAVLMSHQKQSDETMLEFLRGVALFATLTTEQLVRLGSVVKEMTFSGGEHIVRQGDVVSRIIITQRRRDRTMC